jgi:hypothetical protein
MTRLMEGSELFGLHVCGDIDGKLRTHVGKLQPCDGVNSIAVGSDTYPHTRGGQRFATIHKLGQLVIVSMSFVVFVY